MESIDLIVFLSANYYSAEKLVWKFQFSLKYADCMFFFFYQQKALEAAMNDINSSFGKGSVTRLGSAGGALVYVAFDPFRFFFLASG